jgi:hypothetical protein
VIQCDLRTISGSLADMVARHLMVRRRTLARAVVDRIRGCQRGRDQD